MGSPAPCRCRTPGLTKRKNPETYSRRCWSVPGFSKSTPEPPGERLAVDVEGLARHVIDDDTPGVGVAHEAR
eukprot:1690967-Alexandrium_andersonii.AAC.1